MKSFSITQFFANETFKVGEFFKTGAKNQAYAGFPVNNIQLLFYRKEALARQKNETDEDVAKKAQERIEKIHQKLQAYASNPAEETQPNYPNEVVAMVSDWQKLRAEDAPKEQFEEWNQKFNGYVENNPAPLSGLLTEGVKMVGKKAVSSLASKAISAIGTATGPLGKVASFLIAKFGPEVFSLVRRNMKYVGALIGGAIGFILGGFVGGFLGVTGGFILGGGVTGGAAGVQGAFTSVIGGAQALVAGIVGATMSVIIAPLVIAVVAIPASVALILFIINSGAYVIPPGPPITLSNPFTAVTNSGSGNSNLTCGSGSASATADMSVANAIAQRATQIANNLKPGFWNDLNYSPDYPEIWNQARFEVNPNPVYPGPIQSCGTCLFWCTWIVQKSYRESGDTGISSTLGVGGMCNDFATRGKFISAKNATPENIVPGSVVFFSVSGGFDHVGIVASLNQDAIEYVQSNTPTKSGSITFNAGGVGVQKIGGMVVIGFGLP